MKKVDWLIFTAILTFILGCIALGNAGLINLDQQFKTQQNICKMK